MHRRAGCVLGILSAMHAGEKRVSLPSNQGVPSFCVLEFVDSIINAQAEIEKKARKEWKEKKLKEFAELKAKRELAKR